jgi:hypothetical protein
VKAPGASYAETEAVWWWLSTTIFSARHDRQPQWVNKQRQCIHHCQSTYEEICLAMEIDTGVAFSGPRAFLSQRAAAVSKIMRYLIRVYKGRISDDLAATSYNAIFHPRKVRCARDVTGVNSNGVGRRPFWKQKSTEEVITLNLHRAREHHRTALAKDHRTSFGEGFRMKLILKCTEIIWKQSALVETHDAILIRRPAKRNPHQEQCVFGHAVGIHVRRQNLVPMWRGASHGSCLCIACHNTLQRELNDPQQELVLALVPPVNKRHGTNADTGPCFFGHAHTSAEDEVGRPKWYRVPTGTVWHSAPGNSTLCYGCYRQMINDRSMAARICLCSSGAVQ